MEGNHIKDFELDWDYVKSIPIKLTLRPPVVKNLPVDFEFNQNEEREATKLKEIYFFEEAHILEARYASIYSIT